MDSYTVHEDGLENLRSFCFKKEGFEKQQTLFEALRERIQDGFELSDTVNHLEHLKLNNTHKE